jgi:spoIIIJ-associated protein
MDFSEKWGQDVDEAVKLALRDLKCTIDDVDVQVLEEPSKGFLGLGSKLAKVRVTMKNAQPKESKEPAPAVKPATFEAAPPRQEAKQEYSKERRENREPRENREQRQPREQRENRDYKEQRDDRGQRETREFRDSRPQRPRPESSNASTGEPAVVRTKRVSSVTRPDNLEPVESHPALDFLRETTEKMGLELTIKAEANEETLFLSIEGSDSGTIIGKRGQTLDAIQYLTSLVVNKEKDKYIRVVVDAENYRVKRENTLEQLADRLAGKVIKTRRTVRLEPMNPYERMVIHATLQDNPKVKTRSEGEEPYRRVIIELK